MAAQDVGRLTQDQPEVGPVEGNIGEPHDRPSRALLRFDPGGIGLDPRQRHARLDPPLDLHQGELHVDGIRQVGLVELQLFQFGHLPGVGARDARWAFNHPGIVGQDGLGFSITWRYAKRVPLRR